MPKKINRFEIIDAVTDRESYERACFDAQRAASDPNFGTQRVTYKFNSDIPHDISDLIWDNEKLSILEKLHLSFSFYEEMPCYAYLMHLSTNYSEFSHDEKNQFWQWVRVQLESSNLYLVSPIAYSLWCDFFEGLDTVEEAWNKLVSPLPNNRALQQILISSGPVPFELKNKLYMQLISESTWHYYIFRSLLHSAFDYFGDLNKEEGKSILGKLKLPKDTENLNDLIDKLNN